MSSHRCRSGGPVSAEALLSGSSGSHVCAFPCFQPPALLGGPCHGPTLERASSGFHELRDYHDWSFPLCPASSLRGSLCRDVLSAADPHGLDHGAHCSCCVRSSHLAENRRRRTGAPLGSGIPGRDGRQTTLPAGTILI